MKRLRKVWMVEAFWDGEWVPTLSFDLRSASVYAYRYEARKSIRFWKSVHPNDKFRAVQYGPSR